jgi:hypothetical protein
MTASERDLLEELGADAAEGEAELFAAEEEFEAEDMLEGEDALETEDGLEAEDPLDALEEEDAREMEDGLDAEDGAAGEEAMLQAIGEALGAEGEDAFFGKLVRGIATVAERVAPVVGQVARAAAPVLSLIPTRRRRSPPRSRAWRASSAPRPRPRAPAPRRSSSWRPRRPPSSPRATSGRARWWSAWWRGSSCRAGARGWARPSECARSVTWRRRRER